MSKLERDDKNKRAELVKEAIEKTGHQNKSELS
jgi:hypothetical protein